MTINSQKVSSFFVLGEYFKVVQKQTFLLWNYRREGCFSSLAALIKYSKAP